MRWRMDAKIALAAVAALSQLLASCGGKGSANPTRPSAGKPEVGVVRAIRKNLARNLSVSSELVPFQQIDVYAKESGFVQKLNVDYGTHVKQGDVMAVLEIPELQAQLEEDQADIKDATSQIQRDKEEVDRTQALEKVADLEFDRLNRVAKSTPGLVAQQEVDDRQGQSLSAQAQLAAAQAVLQSAQSQLVRAQAKLHHDQVLFDYSKVTAPFTGVVTKRYANYGTLMQSGINTSTQALPLVQLSEDDKFRLVIPVPESYVPDIHIGDQAQVHVASLNRTFPGTVARFSVNVDEETRTMHTEVDVPNPSGLLVPGMYAEATLKIVSTNQSITVPPEALNVEGDARSVWVVEPSGKVEKRTVTLGVETPNDVEVLSGLKEGEMVAVGDRSALTDGEVVQPKQVQLIRYQEGG